MPSHFVAELEALYQQAVLQKAQWESISIRQVAKRGGVKVWRGRQAQRSQLWHIQAKGGLIDFE